MRQTETLLLAAIIPFVIIAIPLHFLESCQYLEQRLTENGADTLFELGLFSDGSGSEWYLLPGARNPVTQAQVSIARSLTLVGMALPGLLSSLLVYRWLLRSRLSSVALCGKCGYDLRANTTALCPECGTPLPEWQRQRISNLELDAK